MLDTGKLYTWDGLLSMRKKMSELVLPVCAECEDEMDCYCPECALCLVCCDETDCCCPEYCEVELEEQVDGSEEE